MGVQKDHTNFFVWRLESYLGNGNSSRILDVT